MEEHTVHEVCNALKRFLRNLHDPLLTDHLYGQWIATAGKYTFMPLVLKIVSVLFLVSVCMCLGMYICAKYFKVNVLKLRTLKNNYYFSLFVILEIMFVKKCQCSKF